MKRRIVLSILSLALLLGIILAIAISALAVGGEVAESDWISAPATTLKKCTGDGCDHENCYAYSFAVIGDTQNLNYHDINNGTTHMKTLYKWLVDNKDAKNIQYVLGVGDITQSWNRNYGDKLTNEWINAAAAVSLLDGKIGYSLVRGNHDFSDAINGFNGVFGIGDKPAGGVDNQYYEDLLALSQTNDSQGRPMAGFRIEGKIEETYRKVTMGNDKYIIVTLDWHPMSRETDCVTDTADLCVLSDYCTVHHTAADCTANPAKCVIKNGCKKHNSFVNGTTFCSFELCTADCDKHDSLGWLDKVLADNSDYTAIITLHSFIMRDGSTVDDIEDVFPYENVNNASRPNWHEVAVTGGNVSPKQLWDEVLSKHANVKLLFSGHVDEDNFITTQLKGKNGNTVTCMLVDGQTIDSAVEPVGMIAMYYVSNDGKTMDVEYLSSVRLAAGKPAYLRSVNQFELNIDYRVSATDDGFEDTLYGCDIPSAVYNAHPFHVIVDDDSNTSTFNTLFGSFDTWDEAIKAVHSHNGITALAARLQKTWYIVMSKDYIFSTSGLSHNQAGNNPSKTVLDLRGHTLTVESGKTFLPFYNATASLHPDFSMINGDVLLKGTGKLFVTQHGHPVNAKGGEVDLTLTDLNITYASGATGSVVTYYSGSANGPSYVNLSVNNCNIDASAAGTVKVFDLKDTNNNSDVRMTVTGGSFTGSTLAGSTFVTRHYSGDTVTFKKDGSGKYMTMTLGESTTIGQVFSSDTKDVYLEFGAPTASAGKYVYELVTSSAVITKYGVIPNGGAGGTNSPENAPFVLFKNNEPILYSKDWKTLIDTSLKGTANYQSGCTLLLRRDYSTSEASASPSWFFRIDDLTIDLDGHVFTRGTNHMFQIFGTEATAHETSIVIKNGTLKTTAAFSPIVFNNAGTNTAIDKLELVLNEVTFDIEGATGGSRGPIVAFGDGNKLGIEANITLNDCTIDRGSSTNSATLFSLLDYKDPTQNDVVNNKTDITVTVNGGTLVADSLANLTVANYSPVRDGMTASADKVILGKGSDGKYLTVKLPKTYTAPTSSYLFTDGNRALGLAGSDANYKYYTFDPLGTVYGDVTAQYVSVETYPFALFYNGAFKAGYSTFAAAINAAVTLTDTEAECAVCDTVYIAMRSDFVSPGSASIPTSRGKIVLDLQGYKLSSTDAYLVSTYINYEKLLADGEALPNTYAYAKNYLGFTSTLTLQNGSLHNGRSNFGIYGVDTKGELSVAGFERKTYVYNFNNIVFTTVSKPIIQTFGSKTGTGHNLDINLDGCTLDFTGASAGTNMFLVGASENAFTVDLDFKDCEVIASKLDSYAMYNASADDTVTVSSQDGSTYLTVTQTSASVPTKVPAAADGSTLAFFEVSTADGKYVYALGKTVDTEHGAIPPQGAGTTDYPIVLFDGDKNYIGTYATFGEAFTRVSTDLTGDYVLLLRRNFTKEDGKYIANFKGSLTVDLGGNTLTISDTGNYLFDLGAGDNTGNTVSFALKNGTVIKAGGRGVACMNYNSNLKDKDTTYNFTFDGVTFRSTNSTYNTNVVFATWENGYDGATSNLCVNSTFTDCTFDLRDSIDGAVMLDLTHSSGTKDRVVHTVTVKGGEILLDDTADFTDGFAKCDKVTAGRYDTVTFVKDEGGKYTVAKVPAGTALAVAVNDGKLTYVKKAEDTTDATYELIPTAALNISFVPRTSITLDANLYLNVYVPAGEYLTSFTLDGDVYDPDSLTANDGYYLFSIELPARNAAREITLVAYFDVEGEALSASFTFSTLRYAEKLLGDADVTATEKTLVCDALNYIRSAYVYFGCADATEVGEAVDTLTDGFTFTPFATVSGTTDLTVPEGVTFILDATPRIRFYFSSGTDLTGYTFKIGNATVPFTPDTETVESVSYECADISLFAYRMIDTIDLYEGESKLGSFQINSYYEFAKGQGSATLVDVVEKFYTYCRSALAYRNSVLQDSGN